MEVKLKLSLITNLRDVENITEINAASPIISLYRYIVLFFETRPQYCLKD